MATFARTLTAEAKTNLLRKVKETKELMGYIADHHDKLIGELTDEQKKTLEKFNNCYDELVLRYQ